MSSRNILAKYALCLGVVTALALQVWAQTPETESPVMGRMQQGMQRRPRQNRGARKGNSGKQHGERKAESEPIVDNWTIREVARGVASGRVGGPQGGKVGTASLTLDPDGSWKFSGNTIPGFGMCHFNIVFGVRSSEGTVVAFKHSAYLKPFDQDSHRWEKQGHNPMLKENFKAFAKDHDWYGSWNCTGAPGTDGGTRVVDAPGGGGGGGNGGGGGGGGGIGQVVGDVVSVLGAILAFF